MARDLLLSAAKPFIMRMMVKSHQYNQQDIHVSIV